MVESERLIFSSYEISSESLKGLTVDQRAMFGILCLTLSEVEALRKAASICAAPIGEDDDIDAAIIDHQQVFFRLIAMKVLEVFKTLMLVGTYNKTNDESLKSFSSQVVQPQVNSLEKHPGFKLWKDQRDKMGFHYDLSKFRGLVELKNNQTRQNALLNEKLNFRSFPYGEMLATSSLGGKGDEFCFKKAWENAGQQGEFLSKAVASFSEVFNEFFTTFVLPVVPSQDVKKPVPKQLIGRRGDISMPLLFLEG